MNKEKGSIELDKIEQELKDLWIHLIEPSNSKLIVSSLHNLLLYKSYLPLEVIAKFWTKLSRVG